MNKILAENKKRLAELFEHYDPYTGEGSKTDRILFKIFSDKKSILIPSSMSKIDWLDVTIPLDKHPGDWNQVMAKFHEERLSHDYEFWTFTCIKIKDKETAERIPFKQNSPQRILTAALEEMRLAGKPIRAIITKARQWGGSTDVQFYMKWIQTRHKKGWHSAIVADVESQSKNVRSMYSNAITFFPTEIQQLSLKNFENQNGVKIIPERECTISIASMQQPDKLRSQDLKMAHLSEVGLWKTTLGKTPEDVIQSLQGTIPPSPYTVFVEESTAKGSGNYFHRSWLKAINKKSNKKAIFIAWFQIELYQKSFTSEDEALKFFSTLNPYEQELWEIGVTLEGINWYRDKLREFDGNTWRMNSEFPSTWQEAFSSTGQRAFSPKYVRNLLPDICDPLYVGDIHGDSYLGENAIKNVHFQEDPKGLLSIWKKPNDPPVPKDHIVKNRYRIIVDVGGASETADPSAITVFDTYHMINGGLPEAVATWHGRMDADLVSWKAAQMGLYYKEGGSLPLLIIEVNFFEKKKTDEGDAFYTTLDEIAPHYDNLFSRTTPDQIKQGAPAKYGFHMNRQTKPNVVLSYNKCMREGMYIEHDERIIGEADNYEMQGKGKYNAVDGQHDDLLVTRMIGIWEIFDYEFSSLVSMVKISNDTEAPEIDSLASF